MQTNNVVKRDIFKRHAFKRLWEGRVLDKDRMLDAEAEELASSDVASLGRLKPGSAPPDVDLPGSVAPEAISPETVPTDNGAKEVPPAPAWLYAPHQTQSKIKPISLPPGVVEGYGPEPEISPSREWLLSREGDGTESPRDLQPTAKYLMVKRTFGFLDMSGFTTLTRQRGPATAAELLTAFRRETRLIASLRGVRVAKWMGDGAMIVSPDPGRTIATGAHIIHHFRATYISVRVGLATGEALLFEGDDYIGEPVNLAFRLCEAAEAGEILADVREDALPTWVKKVGKTVVDVRGLGQVGNILRLQPDLH